MMRPLPLPPPQPEPEPEPRNLNHQPILTIMQKLFYLLTFLGLTATFLFALILWDQPILANLLPATGSLTLTLWSWIMADHVGIVRRSAYPQK